MDFVAKQNIANFRRLHKTETDPKKRAILEQLLQREEAKIGPPSPAPAVRG